MSANWIKASAVRLYFVPEGQHDRSLARSAWKAIHRENRPVGYGMIGHSYPRHPSVFLVEDVRRIGAQACVNQTVPYGTALLGGAVPGTACQATIAGPSGTKAIRPTKSLASSTLTWLKLQAEYV